MPKRAIRRLRRRNRALRDENARLRRDLAAASGYARELQDRVLDEISRCSELRAGLEVPPDAATRAPGDAGGGAA